MREGCSHGCFFSLLQLLSQGLDLTEKVAPLPLVLSLFGFCLENGKIKLEQSVLGPRATVSVTTELNHRAWMHSASVSTGIHWLLSSSPRKSVSLPSPSLKAPSTVSGA